MLSNPVVNLFLNRDPDLVPNRDQHLTPNPNLGRGPSPNPNPVLSLFLDLSPDAKHGGQPPSPATRYHIQSQRV